MNDLDDLGRLLDASATSAPPELRARVMAATWNGPALPGRPGRAIRRPSRRLLGSLGLSAAVAAAVVAAMVVSGTPGSGTTQQSGPSRAEGATAPTDPGAVQVLHRAATVVSEVAVTPPRPDQFVFTEFLQDLTLITDGHRGPSLIVRDFQWRSVDGTRDGLGREEPDLYHHQRPETIPGCPVSGKDLYGQECSPYPGYLLDAPTDADAMLRYIRAHDPSDNPSDRSAFSYASSVIGSQLMSPESQAAMFEALARIPGLTRVPGLVTDGAGRKGIAVGLPNYSLVLHPGDRWDLIFDPNTFELLGTRYVYMGQEVRDYTRIRTAIVDRPGQLP